MNEERIEALLERIAVALETLAGLRDDSKRPTKGLTGHSLATELGGPSDSAPPASQSRAPLLQAFLDSKGIQIRQVPAEDSADQVIDSLSLYLGEHYDALSGLLGKIKRAMQNGLPIMESLKNRSQQDINSACQFCTRLHEVAFLEQYQYFRSPTYLIKAKPTTLPRAQRFFSGQWLERFLLQKIKSVRSQLAAQVNGHLDFEYLINPEVILPNGDDFELDILAAIGSSIYWIEAKSGDYQRYVEKYSRFSRVLGLDSAHSMMVLADVSDDRCDALSSLFSMTVCNLRSFEDRLLSVARRDTAHQSAAADGQSPAPED